MANVHQLERLSDLATLMDNEKYSDLTITCNGREFRVHKAVMCSASSVIAGACDSDMKEGNTNIIEHTEYDADTMEGMISYTYRQKYTVYKFALPVTVKVPELSESPYEEVVPHNVNGKLMAHARVYAIADYYHVRSLKTFAIEQFYEAVQTERVIDGFIYAVREVYRLTSAEDSGIRGATRTVALHHINELVNDEAFMTELMELEGIQEFAADILRQMAKEQKQGEKAIRQGWEELNKQITDAEKRARDTQNDLQHAKDVTKWLEDAVKAVQFVCRNGNCTSGRLYLERKGHSQRGPGQGDWQIRCSACRARQN